MTFKRISISRDKTTWAEQIYAFYLFCFITFHVRKIGIFIIILLFNFEIIEVYHVLYFRNFNHMTMNNSYFIRNK